MDPDAFPKRRLPPPPRPLPYWDESAKILREDRRPYLDRPTEDRGSEDPRDSPPDPPRPSGRRHPRRRPHALLVLAAAAVVTAVAGVWVAQRLSPPASPNRPPGAVDAGGYRSLAWVVRHGTETFVSVVAVPVDRPPIAVTFPLDLAVDMPGGGPATIGQAALHPELLVAAAQGVLERRVHDVLVREAVDMGRLIDAIGGVRAVVEGEIRSGDAVMGPGPVQLDGSAALAYLSSAFAEIDGHLRWGHVLAGLLAADADGETWERALSRAGGPEGDATETAAIANLLAGARDAQVVQLPTLIDDFGALQKDAGAFAQLEERLGTGGELVRVVVLNGLGRPGVALELAARLAREGFWVVAAQNAPSFDVEETSLVAAERRFEEMAQRARASLGVGKVYVGVQPTGIADVTIVVGRDFEGG